MANRNGRKIFISLVIGVVVACVSLNTFSNMKKEIKEKDQLIEVMKLRDRQIESGKYSYLTATHDMEAGSTVTEDDVVITAFASEQEDGLTSKEMVIGNVLLEPVKNGQILTGYSFTGVSQATESKGLREGHRALTLSTSTLDGMSSEMKEGSLIDIFSKSKNNSFVLSKVRIIALEPTTTDTTKDKDKNLAITQAKSATFEVPVNKIQELVDIYASGKILLVMRPVGDDTVIVGTKKQEQTTTNTNSLPSYNNSYHGSSNYSYNTASLPPLPVTPFYEEQPPVKEVKPIVTEVPKKQQKTVELIKANNKTQISFD